MAVDWGTIGLPTTPTAGALYPGSVLAKASKGYEAALAAKTGYAERSLAAAYGQAFKQVEKEMAALAARMQAEMAKGNYSPSWTMQQDRYKRLLNQYSEAIKSFNAATVAQVNQVHQEGIQAALKHTPSEVRDYMGGTAPTGITLPDFGPETWGTINKEAYARAVGYLNQQGAPLRDLIEKMGTDTLHAVQTEWAKGMALGYNPRKIARNIANATANISLGRAKTIARTEFHRAYRETKGEQIAASDVTQGWVWKANLDSETCGLCVAMGGSVHPKGDMLDSHPNCRCSMVPLTKTWADLGFPGVPGDRPAALDTPSGPEWLSKQSESQIKKTLGKARGQDFIDRGGTTSPTLARIITRNYVQQTDNPTWGPMKRLAPFGGKSSIPKATGTAPVAPPLPVKAPPVPKAPAIPKPPAVTLPKPLAAAATKVQGYFDKMVKAAKSPSTKLGKDWLTQHVGGGTGYSSARLAKDTVATDIAHIAKADLDDLLTNWDGTWSGGGYGGGNRIMVKPTGSYYGYNLPDRWDLMSPAQRRAFLAGPEGELLRREMVADIVQTWASTSADTNPLSLLAQSRAETIFGMSTQTAHLSNNSAWAAAMAAPPPVVRLMDSTLKAMYQNTQRQFAAEGITHIRLIRGQGWPDQYRPDWAKGMSYQEERTGAVMIQPLSSFSSSKAIAKRFKPSRYSGGVYIIADFPVEWIVGTARTGFGCLEELEFVVAGGRPMTVTVRTE